MALKQGLLEKRLQYLDFFTHSALRERHFIGGRTDALQSIDRLEREEGGQWREVSSHGLGAMATGRHYAANLLRNRYSKKEYPNNNYSLVRGFFANDNQTR